MRSINISKFKAAMGKYLKMVQQGESLVLLDRKTPVAKMIPYQDKASLRFEVRPSVEDPSGLARLTFSAVKGRKTNTLDLLLEDRRSP